VKDTPLQVAAKEMRRHWYDCDEKWGRTPGFIHCTPGWSHPKCVDGTKLEKEYIRLIQEVLYNTETWCGWCGRYKLCREYNMNGFSVTSCEDCDKEKRP